MKHFENFEVPVCPEIARVEFSFVGLGQFARPLPVTGQPPYYLQPSQYSVILSILYAIA